ncbi:uncharacterized protein SPAPADRAFT_139605 [Spathaspora passalidarum NRRL Y-27907]|uniref:EKC/KEOPS complex subunit CGI121 n=1 Tax=Spathaspora passalidarum (strain NRRL Y-27907 / 11-Y1) TaxID=619300 RepID=G3ANS2_SPAPN|nr:uncharacterized protein SPAPADRAFT_139605 [Spathaspora passalidarum NRRL Y-27907]EGW32007.1 hypothetical protein SPAPADRAFT_139605 [Spathaspora passalidarum NRRL Y-27907]
MYITFPQFPKYKVYISLHQNISSEKLQTIKENLASQNSEYNYCFLNAHHIISLAHLQQAIHRSVMNYSRGTMSAKTVNAEIILNLSPVNSIMDAFKNFGIREDCDSAIVVKIIEEDSNEDVSEKLTKLVGPESELNDQVLFDLVDFKRFKKVYKLNDAKFTHTQNDLSKLAIGACILRGC